MNVSLTEHLDKFVGQQVETGRYSSASEVVREGLRLLEQREAQVQNIQNALDEGFASPITDGPEAMKRIRNRIQTHYGLYFCSSSKG